MDNRRRSSICAAALLVLASACSAGDDQSTASTPDESDYCGDLGDLIRLLDDGGTIDEYNELMTRIADESPADHAPTWYLMLALSAEPFSYDNFNAAVDSLEQLDPDLSVTCAGLGRWIVDDAGRVRSLPTG